MTALSLRKVEDGFDIVIGNTVLLCHRPHSPAFFVGRGRPDPNVPRQLQHRRPSRRTHRSTIRTRRSTIRGGRRSLAGRRFPLWTSEPGVGRDKSTLLTLQADHAGRAGGDFWNTNYPQPTFLSSRHYALHVNTTAYTCFDFRDPAFHEIEVWDLPARVELSAAARFHVLVTHLSTRFGRPTRLPDWTLSAPDLKLRIAPENAPASSFAFLVAIPEGNLRLPLILPWLFLFCFRQKSTEQIVDVIRSLKRDHV